MKKKILSGMRPTGKLHLGHLVGALDNWVKFQEEYDCFFMVADWHAFMSEYENTAELPGNIMDNVVDWLSVGIDPDKSTVFIQSHIPEHAELHMVFSCLTPLGLLERCPTYKEQMREVKARNLNTYGFLGYPVLQAADILLYKADKVPVGQDQLPHLELTRQVARLFNNLSKKEIFPSPDAILTKTPKLLGLDGRKMSKSYLNTINLSDSPEVIMRKVSAMFTDPQRVKLSDKGHPDTCNVFSYYSVFMPQLKNEVCAWCLNAKKGCTECKKMLALAIIEKLAPIQEKRKSLLKDKAALKKILDAGAKKAAGLASGTMQEVRKAVNL
ncbi:MAG: tryptophan--tRNA ligase [Candidatus Omnitrophica bacterium]|nr:tryptophan--tRNA ligase [Candidatus Omnitrophota bacterium]MDD5027510.1 tryptophan--tRNA ligase [Candidatus Omnitrophota bacterium]MDD5662323.1 tryptophan--tRNA ligase [Candidatus Omnitrophota bacterium]